MPVIRVQNLVKEFRLPKRQSGLLGSVRTLFTRQVTVTRVVDGVSFDIIGVAPCPSRVKSLVTHLIFLCCPPIILRGEILNEVNATDASRYRDQRSPLRHQQAVIRQPTPRHHPFAPFYSSIILPYTARMPSPPRLTPHARRPE